MDCRVFSAAVPATLYHSVRQIQAHVERGRSVQVIDPSVDGVHGSLIPTTSSLGEPSPYACQEAPYPRRNLEVVYLYCNSSSAWFCLRRGRDSASSRGPVCSSHPSFPVAVSARSSDEC